MYAESWETEYTVRLSNGGWFDTFSDAGEAIKEAAKIPGATVERVTKFMDRIETIWPKVGDDVDA